MKAQKRSRTASILRVLYLANVLGAGVPGSIMILAPTWAKTYMYSWPTDDFLFGITASIWMAIGLVSLLGLRFPIQLAPVFLVQMVYKVIWIVSVGIPLGNSGLSESWYYVGGFALVAIAFGVGFPYRIIFHRTNASQS